MSGCGGPAVTPVCCRRCFLRLDDAFTLPVTTWAFNDGQLPGHKNSRSLRRHERGAPLTRTPPRRSWGRGPPPPGWRRIQARRSTCLLLRAVQRRRVESLVLMLSRSRANRAVEAARRVGGGLIVATLNVGGLRAGAGAPTDAGSERSAGREGDRRAEHNDAPTA